jgi:hypothetical protein
MSDEDQCLICRYWPPEDRPRRRIERFSADFVLMPKDCVCDACELAFWELTAKRPTKH